MKNCEYIPGQFYMVIVANDPDIDHAWEAEKMPARFDGYDEDGNELWNYLDPDSACWPVRWSEPIGAQAGHATWKCSSCGATTGDGCNSVGCFANEEGAQAGASDAEIDALRVILAAAKKGGA